jgi:hypothetical protein
MNEREALYTLSGKVQVDDPYLGGERIGGKAGYRFNRRFDRKSLSLRRLLAAAQCGPPSQGSVLMGPEVHC